MIQSKVLSVMLLFSVSFSALAQEQGGSEPDVPEKAGKELRAERIRGDAPRVDDVP